MVMADILIFWISIGNRASNVHDTSSTWHGCLMEILLALEHTETLLAMSEQERKNIAFTLGIQPHSILTFSEQCQSRRISNE